MFSNSSIHKRNVFKKFYEKTGIQLTEEPIINSPASIQDELEELHHLALEHPKIAAPRLEKLVPEYPTVPSLKNYLYNAYARLGEKEKSAKILQETIEQHPHYVFGMTNTILNIHDADELRKHRHLLGSPMTIQAFLGVNRTIHILEFTNYQIAAAHYELKTGDEAAAKNRLQSLIDVEVEEEQLDILVKMIVEERISSFANRLRKRNELKKSVESLPKAKLPQTKTRPVFTHPEVEIFYKKSPKSLSDAEREQILALPKSSLVADLELIVEDSIRRFDYFNTVNYDEDQHEFLWHALYFLAVLEAEDSLEKVLNLLRMGNGFVDFWFADYNEQVFYPVLFNLGKNQLEVLKNYVIEEDLYQFDRYLVSMSVSQIALHQPNRRQEVLDWYKDIYHYFLENPTNERLIDTDFIAFSVGHLIDIRGKELLPVIEKMYQNQWISDDVQGDLATITKEIQEEAHPYEIKPLPANIHEYYSLAYVERRVERPPLSEEDQKIYDSINGEQSEAEMMIFKGFAQAMFGGLNKQKASLPDNDFYDDYEDDFSPYHHYEKVETVVRTSPKIGRNDPCPCGSGKKYKKCCLKKK